MILKRDSKFAFINRFDELSRFQSQLSRNSNVDYDR